MNIVALALAAIELEKLNKELGKPKLKEKFKVLDTNDVNAEDFWNNLNSDNERFEVADAAFHFNLFTANYRWDTRNTKYKDLKPKQKKCIKFVFDKKDEIYIAFDLRFMVHD